MSKTNIDDDLPPMPQHMPDGAKRYDAAVFAGRRGGEDAGRYASSLEGAYLKVHTSPLVRDEARRLVEWLRVREQIRYE